MCEQCPTSDKSVNMRAGSVLVTEVAVSDLPLMVKKCLFIMIGRHLGVR